ncbi:MAG: SurA N-terminal domain-containing protein [Proteobacteria bacterium]|nr:SurA N-terminal domain-containing protein [Pseudomonadota bacterium]
MLEQIRKNVRHPYIQVLLGLIILVFILFFGWSMRSQKPTYVAKVNGTTIDYRSYQQAYNGLLRVYQEAFKGDLSGDRIRELGLGRRALDQLVDRVLLEQEAARRDLEVTEAELQSAIQAVPAFQEDGGFSKQLYLRILEANRLSPLEYETSKRQELLLQKVEAAIRAEAKVSDADVEKEFQDRNTKIELEYVALSPASLEVEVKPTDADLADFYAAEGESFRVPEKRSARYVLFAPEDFLASVQATEQEAREEYGWRKEEFAVAEAVRARHLLLRVEAGAKPEEDAKVKERAEKLRAEILGGKPFAEVAKKNSEDPGTKENGGELGYFERGQMVPEFEEVAFALPPGEVSEPVRTAFGYHLILVEDHRQARQRPFEEVAEELTAEIRRRKALEEAYAAADNLLMDLEDGKTTWAAIEASRTVHVTDALTKDETPKGVEKPTEFITALFGLAPDKAGALLETPAGTYLMAVAAVEPSAVPPLDQVRDRVAARFRMAEARRLAEARAKAFLVSAAEVGWEAAVKTAGLGVQRTDSFAKKGGAVPKIGWAPDLKEAAFALKEVGELAAEPYEVSGNFYAFRLAARNEADPAQLDAEREKLREELLPSKQEEYFQRYVETLRKSADIKVNEELLL